MTLGVLGSAEDRDCDSGGLYDEWHGMLGVREGLDSATVLDPRVNRPVEHTLPLLLRMLHMISPTVLQNVEPVAVCCFLG